MTYPKKFHNIMSEDAYQILLKYTGPERIFRNETTAQYFKQDKPTALLTACTVAYLQSFEKADAWNQKSTGTYREVDGVKKWTNSSARKGIPDVTARYRGMALELEIKYGADTMHESQYKFEKNMESCETPYRIIKTLDDVIEVWKSFKPYVDAIRNAGLFMSVDEFPKREKPAAKKLNEKKYHAGNNFGLFD